MKALIPLAGKGTRLLPYTLKRQKALLPVAGKTVLDHILEPLITAGVDKVTLVVGYLEDQIRRHMSRYRNLSVTYVQQPRQRGLGEAVFLGLTEETEPVLIVLADTIFDMDYHELITESGNLIGVVEVEDPRRFGVVETVGRQIVGMVEKPDEPPSNLAIVGIYRIEDQTGLKQALAMIMDSSVKTKGEFQLTDALNLMVARGDHFRTFPVNGWLDCGTKETLLATNRYLLQNMGNPFVHPEATVQHSTVRSSTIMEHCSIVESTLDGCIVLPGAQLEKCRIRDEIIEEDAQLSGYLSGS